MPDKIYSNLNGIRREMLKILGEVSSLTKSPLAIEDVVNGRIVAAAMDDAGLHRWCAERLPSPRRPRLIQRVATLPRNPMGKLQRPALRQLAGR